MRGQKSDLCCGCRFAIILLWMWLIEPPLTVWGDTIFFEIKDKILCVRKSDTTGLGYVAHNAISTNLVPLAQALRHDGSVAEGPRDNDIP